MKGGGVICLRDGRRLAWEAWGEPDGLPLLRLHGTPGSRLLRNPDEQLASRAGARIVTFDRPGYGLSTRHEGRTFLSCADDALELAGHLGWTTFSVLGVSGGGPHALALAVREPKRIRRVGVVGTATPGEWWPEVEHELLEHNRQGLAHARAGRESLRAFLAPLARQLVQDPLAASADAPAPDREILEREAFRAIALENLREAFRQGVDAWVDEARALSEPWNFELAQVEAPVLLWHGELDRNTPLRLARRLAAGLPDAHLTVLTGRGHRGWLDHEEDLLALLLR